MSASESPSPVTMIAAVADNGVIGHHGRMPWHLGTDLKRFRSLTSGHAIVMGRRTWDSIGRPLLDRLSIVVTRNEALIIDGAFVVHSLDEAIAVAATAGRAVDVIGGAEIYARAIERADVLQLTRVHATPQGDTFFTEVGPEWTLAAEESHRAGPNDDHPFTFQTWQR